MKSQIKKIAICILVVLSTIACKKETIETKDATASKIEFTISGDGISKTFYSDSSYTYGQLNLRPNTSYSVSVRGNDNCCMKIMRFSAVNHLTYTGFTSTPSFTTSTFGFTKTHTIADSTTTPRLNSFMLDGSIKTRSISGAGSDNFDFSMVSYDFNNNRTELSIPVSVSNSPIIGFGWIKL